MTQKKIIEKIQVNISDLYLFVCGWYIKVLFVVLCASDIFDK